VKGYKYADDEDVTCMASG